jgi:hypothetical protein
LSVWLRKKYVKREILRTKCCRKFTDLRKGKSEEKNEVVRKFTICIHCKTQDDYSKEDECVGHAVEPLIHMPLFSYEIRKVDMSFVENNKRTQKFCMKIIWKATK